MGATEHLTVNHIWQIHVSAELRTARYFIKTIGSHRGSANLLVVYCFSHGQPLQYVVIAVNLSRTCWRWQWRCSPQLSSHLEPARRHKLPLPVAQSSELASQIPD